MSTLMLVHAHPDDESILTGGVMARAHLEGHRVVLVTATRGEDGELPDLSAPTAGTGVARVRSLELLQACGILGVDRQEFLGYTGSAHAADPSHDDGSFIGAPLGEVSARLAGLMREERPDVVVTYTADGTYAHPDHMRAHTATIAALDTLVDEGWQPSKLYLHAVPRSFVTSTLAAARDAGIPLPDEFADIEGIPDEQITTAVDVSSVLDRKLAACVAHSSQMHPGLPLATMAADLFEAAFGFERFVLARGELGTDPPEPDLFAGL